MTGEELKSERRGRVLSGFSYLLLFLGLIGIIVDVLIYYSTKNKSTKFHAGQACFLALIINLIGILLTFTVFIIPNSSFIMNPFGSFASFTMNRLSNPLHYGIPTRESSMAMMYGYFSLIVFIIYILLAIFSLYGKNFRIPIAAKLLEK